MSAGYDIAYVFECNRTQSINVFDTEFLEDVPILGLIKPRWVEILAQFRVRALGSI